MSKIKKLLSRPYFWLAMVILLAAILRLWGTGYGLPGYAYHTDGSLYIRGVLSWLEGDSAELSARSDFPSLFFGLLFVLFGTVRWISSWFASTSPAFSDYIFVGRVVSAFFSVSTVGLIYLLARRLFNRTVGLLSALALAVTFLDVQISHYVKHDVYVEFFGVLALFFTWLLYEKKKWLYLWLALGTIVLAGTTKLYGFLFLLPLLLVIMAVGWRAKKDRDWSALWRSLAWLLVIIVVLAIFLGIYTQRSSTNAPEVEVFESKYFGRLVDRLLNPFRDVDMVLASDADGIPNYLWWPQYLAMVGVYYPLFISAIAGIILLLRRISFKVIWLLSFPAVYVVVLCLQTVRFDRWASVLTPFLAVAAGFFAYWYLQKTKTLGVIFRYCMGIGLFLVLFAWPGIRVSLFDYIISQPATREEVSEYVGNNTDPGHVVFSYGSSATAQMLIRDYPGFSLQEIDGWIDGQKNIFRFHGEKMILDKSQYDIAYNYRATDRYRLAYKTLELISSRSVPEKIFSYQLFDNGLFSPTNLEHGSTVNNYHQPPMYLFTIPDVPDLELPPFEKIYSAESMADISSAKFSEVGDRRRLVLDPDVADGIAGGREAMPAGTYQVEFALAAESPAKSETIATVSLRDFGLNSSIISSTVGSEPDHLTGQTFHVTLPLKLTRATLVEFTVNDQDLPGTKIWLEQVKIIEAPIDEEDFTRRQDELVNTNRSGTFSAQQIANFTNISTVTDSRATNGFVIKNKPTGGPYLELPPGDYQAVFSLIYDIPDNQDCANLDVVTGGGGQTLASQTITGSSAELLAEKTLDFSQDTPGQIEARLNYLGCGQVMLDQLEIKSRYP